MMLRCEPRRYYNSLLVAVVYLFIIISCYCCHHHFSTTTIVDAFTLTTTKKQVVQQQQQRRPSSPLTTTRTTTTTTTTTRTTSSSLSLAIDDETVYYKKIKSKKVLDRLDLLENGLFPRWRYLQKILDYEYLSEEDVDDLDDVLYQVLDGVIENYKNSDFNKEGAPVLTELKRREIEAILADADNEGHLISLKEPDCSSDLQKEFIEMFEKLLPNPQDEEDAYNGLWETLVELHGREAVNIEKEKNTSQWYIINTTARLLLYFNWLSVGVYQKNYKKDEENSFQ